MPRRGGRAGRREATLDELADESWISVRGGFPVEDVLQSVAAATSVRRRVVQRINDFRVIEEPVLAAFRSAAAAVLARRIVGINVPQQQKNSGPHEAAPEFSWCTDVTVRRGPWP